MSSRLAYLLLSISFIGGAFVAVLDPQEMLWHWFLPAFAIGVLGVVILRRSAHADASSDHKVSGDIATLQSSLSQIVSNLEQLNARKTELPPYDVRFEIDRMFRMDLNRFVNARESIKHAYSLRDYADIMSAFAAGERYINRVWSASADGYVDEVQTYLERAQRQFGEAKCAFDKLVS